MSLSRTKKYAAGSILFFIGSIAVAGFTFQQVTIEGNKLEQQMEVVGKNKLMQEKYNELLVVLDDTADEHEALGSYLLTEGKTINFLSEIETRAREMGLQFTTDSLTVAPLPNPKFQTIELKLKAEGQREPLNDFLTLLETLPYFSRITELNLSKKDESNGSVWTASITLLVGLHAYDE